MAKIIYFGEKKDFTASLEGLFASFQNKPEDDVQTAQVEPAVNEYNQA